MQSSQYSGDHIQMQLEHVKRTYIVPVASGCTLRRTATKAQYSNRAQRGHKIAFLTQLDRAKTFPNHFLLHAQVWPRQILEVTNSEAIWNLATIALQHYEVSRTTTQVDNLPRILNDVKLFFQNSQKNHSFSWHSVRETSDLTKKNYKKNQLLEMQININQSQEVADNTTTKLSENKARQEAQRTSSKKPPNIPKKNRNLLKRGKRKKTYNIW